MASRAGPCHRFCPFRSHVSPLTEEGRPAGAVEPLFPPRCPRPAPGFSLVPPCAPGGERTPGSFCLASGGFPGSGIAPFAESMDNVNEFRMSNISVWGTKRKKNNSPSSLRGEAAPRQGARVGGPLPLPRGGFGSWPRVTWERRPGAWPWLLALGGGRLCGHCRVHTMLVPLPGARRAAASWRPGWGPDGTPPPPRLLPAPRGRGPTPILGAHTQHPRLLRGAPATAKGVGRGAVGCPAHIY